MNGVDKVTSIHLLSHYTEHVQRTTSHTKSTTFAKPQCTETSSHSEAGGREVPKLLRFVLVALGTLVVLSPIDTLKRLVSLSDSADESPFSSCVETSSSPPLALSEESGSADAVALCCRGFPVSQLLAVEPSVRAFLIGFDAMDSL